MSHSFCNHIDCSPPGSPVHGISQASMLEGVTIPFSRDLPGPGIQPVSLALAGGVTFTAESPGEPRITPTGHIMHYYFFIHCWICLVIFSKKKIFVVYSRGVLVCYFSFLFYFFLLLLFCLHHSSCGISVPWPGIEPAFSAVKAQSPNTGPHVIICNFLFI